LTGNGNDNNPLQDGDNIYPATGTGIWGPQTLTRTFVDHPFGQYWGFVADGIYKTDAEAANGPKFNGNTPHAGDLKYRDISGPKDSADGIINGYDQAMIGNPFPKFSYGVNISLSWKKFDLAMLWNGVAGVQLYNGVLPYEIAGIDGGNVTSKVFNTSNFNGNGVTSLPDFSSGNGNYTNPSSFFVENGAYLKLKNLQVAYNVTGKFIQKLRIKNAKVYVMANNVLCFTKYRGADPEIGSQFPTYDKGSVTNNTTSVSHAGTTNRGWDRVGRYPSIKTYSFGIDVTF
jgi:TonB-dependent starch-binding outer membrane protein SusC